MSAEITIEQFIGRNLKRMREGRGLSQVEFGEKVGNLIGTNWKPQTVSAAERGKRQFTAAELLVISHVLGTSVDLLFRDSGYGDAVKVTEKLSLNLRSEVFSRRPDLNDEMLLDTFSDVHQVAGELVKMASDAQRTSQAIAEVAHLAKRLSEFRGPRAGNGPIVDGPNRTAVIAETIQKARDKYQSPGGSNA